MTQTKKMTSNEIEWLDTIPLEDKHNALRARRKWNAQTNQPNQWSELSAEERNKETRKEAETFLQRMHLHYNSHKRLPMWTICRPTNTDFPAQWVARLHFTFPRPEATETIILGYTLESVRDELPLGLINLGRKERDANVIEETWI